ncbi:FAD-dependent oxidoreductase [Sphingobacterium sp. E70]|uniref:FAD-dependent oxidoreductase n=1 Tax=Sphingobacterium sp. E70 TaxID=2853439 RepID=UPI00211C3AF4|nr:FAD-dependent oxidoreductase [Sphingobacterium sp. E70]ULT28989.1 FAD-dependent oxidoreductase [Sphingobacterium sp. E70]
MSGVCAAITAARQGLRVVLVQDRSVLGGMPPVRLDCGYWGPLPIWVTTIVGVEKVELLTKYWLKMCIAIRRVMP